MFDDSALRYKYYMSLNKIKINNTTTVNTGIVYDISEATGRTYTDLADALGTDGNNVPESVRKGGMSVRFVQKNDEKYIQYRLTTNEWSINSLNWVCDNETLRKIDVLSEYIGTSDGLDISENHEYSYAKNLRYIFFYPSLKKNNLVCGISFISNGYTQRFSIITVNDGGDSANIETFKEIDNTEAGKLYFISYPVKLQDNQYIGISGTAYRRLPTGTTQPDAYVDIDSDYAVTYRPNNDLLSAFSVYYSDIPNKVSELDNEIASIDSRTDSLEDTLETLLKAVTKSDGVSLEGHEITVTDINRFIFWNTGKKLNNNVCGISFIGNGLTQRLYLVTVNDDTATIELIKEFTGILRDSIQYYSYNKVLQDNQYIGISGIAYYNAGHNPIAYVNTQEGNSVTYDPNSATAIGISIHYFIEEVDPEIKEELQRIKKICWQRA